MKENLHELLEYVRNLKAFYAQHGEVPKNVQIKLISLSESLITEMIDKGARF